MQESNLDEKLQNLIQNPKNQDVYDASLELMEVYEQYDAEFGNIENYIIESPTKF